MSKRLLEYTPKELQNLTRDQFVQGIRTSESRVIGAYVCPFAPNYLEKVSNMELVAGFGADYITFEGFDPMEIQVPGLPSKNPQDDTVSMESLAVPLGKGYTIPELKAIAGRPIGALLLVPMYDNQEIGGIYGKSVFSESLVRYVLDAGYDFIALAGYDQAMIIDAVKRTKAIVGNKIAIEAGVPHGAGSPLEQVPYNLKEVSTPAFVSECARAGADIIDIPAVGVAPGFTIDYVAKLAHAAHRENAIVAASVAHSVEGSNEEVIARIVLDNKVAGVDVFNIAAGGVFEAVAVPEVLQASCIAVKGKRHTYRRMTQSILR